MIRHTFCLINGIGDRFERRLWHEGITSWDAFISSDGIGCMARERKEMADKVLLRCAEELERGNARHFAGIMKRREHWRLYDSFADDVLCLDIETNGLRPGYGGIVTVVGLYDGREWKCLVRGENLSRESLAAAMAGHKCLITFYGSCFDVPFLMRSFPGVPFDMPHFDLCFGARRLGFNGGLKKLEAAFGISRGEAVRGMNGYDAVRLWDAAEQGSREALELLLHYNREDTVNLAKLAEAFYGRLRQSTGIEGYLYCGSA